jgi:hypothetical protein
VNKAALWITAIILFGIALVLLIYQEWFGQRPLQTWDLVSPDAALVWEAPPRGGAQYTSRGSFVFPVASFVPGVPDSTSLPTLLTARSFLVSVHAVSRDDFDFVWYADLSRNAQRTALEGLFGHYRNDRSLAISDRRLDGVTIHEVRRGAEVFGFVVEENILVASRTPFLLEDVVRLIRDRKRPRFRQEQALLFRLSNVREDDGNMYINMSQASRLASSVFSEETGVSRWARGFATDLKISREQWLMNGFLLDSLDGERGWMSLLRGQRPVPTSSLSLVPEGTGVLTDLHLSDPAAWYAEREVFPLYASSAVRDSVKSLESKHGFVWKDFLTWAPTDVLAGELLINAPGKYLLLRTPGPELARAQLNRLAARLTPSGDSLYVESFGSYEIRKVPLARIPVHLFWPYITSFGELYYAVSGDHLLFAESDQGMKQLLSAMDEDRTWGKSTDRNAFLGTTLQEYNYGWFFDVEAGWRWLTEKLHPRWREHFELRKDSILRNKMIVFQASRLEDKFYTSLVVSRRPIERAEYAASDAAAAPEPIPLWDHSAVLVRLFPVVNHQTRADEFLIQDSLNVLHLVNAGGTKLWSLPIPAKIRGGVTQIDYFKNRKLQYFFSAGSQIYVVDRTGKPVAPFPRNIGTRELEFATAVDYDNSRRYRFFLADVHGNIYLLDESGKSLDGWNPKVLDRNLAAAPRHFRVSGRDYLLAVSAGGRVHLFNRRGEYIKGFPADLDDRVLGDPSLITASGAAGAGLRFVTESGEIIVVGFDGTKQYTDRLVKVKTDEKFAMIHPPGKLEFILAYSADGIRVFSAAAQPLFTSAFGTDEPLGTQGYDLGASRYLFAVHDKSQGYSYLYKDRGIALSPRPVESGRPLSVRLTDKGKKVKFYYIHANRLETTTLPW